MSRDIEQLIRAWREDSSATYQTWFLWEERLKNFRSIQRGLTTVVDEIEAGSFGNTYKGSSLETVVGSIAEQRQIFKGADHAFLWKPKLRIPDIYENAENQRAFARFLDSCACCDAAEPLVRAINTLDARKIKGLGPAAANLLYFLHPTLMPPFNTAIVRGYNLLTGAKTKLGRWDEYLAMREGILRLNDAHRSLLSNDLGAIAGFLFDVGSGSVNVVPGSDALTWQSDLERVRGAARSAAKRKTELTHTQVQGWLRDLGSALEFDVWVASNDRGRPYADGSLGDGTLDDLPDALRSSSVADTIRLIDVLWLEKEDGHVAAAFEVEHTTSIYSGIVRLLDLALCGAAEVRGLYPVAPDKREEDVRVQLARPAFERVRDLAVRYLPYGALEQNRAAMGRFGQGLKALHAVAKPLAGNAG